MPTLLDDPTYVSLDGDTKTRNAYRIPQAAQSYRENTPHIRPLAQRPTDRWSKITPEGEGEAAPSRTRRREPRVAYSGCRLFMLLELTTSAFAPS
jgi:hypothetical protein